MTNAAFDQAAASGGVGLGDYLIYPDQPLPALSVGRNMAYRAVSRERPDQAYFALVCDPAALPRLEAIEAALAAPAARGQGQLADDVFALGMTAAFLLLGGNPAAGLVEDDLLRARIDFGSYTTLIADRRIPVSMIDFMRGLLADDPKLR